MWGVRNYPTEYRFAEALATLFECKDLQALGREESSEYTVFAQANDQSTRFHRQFYDGFAMHVRPVYEDFIRHWVVDLLNCADLLYQTVPTFRIHLPGNLAVGEFHCDGDYGHQNGEINFWLPVTKAYDTNSVWIESSPGRGDFTAAALRPGQILLFDAVRLRHGNRVNETGVARVSLDFRCIPRSVYVDTGRTSVSAKRRMVVGDYWTALSS